MRAMPSPTSRTVPTSSTSTSALIVLDLRLEDGGDLFWSELHLGATSHLRVLHVGAQLFYSGPQAGVEDHVADAQHQAADHALVYLLGEAHAAAGAAFHALDQLVLGRLGERPRPM